MKTWLTVKEAAACPKSDRVILRRALQAGRLTAFRINNGLRVQFRADDIDWWLPNENDLAADAHVFGDETGAREPSLGQPVVGGGLQEGDIVDLNFHDLRYKFGSQLLGAGGELHEAQGTLGHTTIGMTGRYSQRRAGRRQRRVQETGGEATT
jgi:integrase